MDETLPSTGPKPRTEDDVREALRRLPSVDALLDLPVVEEGIERLSRPLAVKSVRRAVDAVRREILAGKATGDDPREDNLCLDGSAGRRAWEARLRLAFAEAERRALSRVINASGVVLHTNLGRAPLSAAALRAVERVAAGYTNLEYEVDEGRRGSRHLHGEELLVEISGAEAAMVVNNNAAAVLLVLSALAHGGEVILSRGEMIEIGGAFRIPDVLRQSGCRLVEVGTTNRTRLADYREAFTEATSALLKVHTSNYKVIGFTESVEARELVGLAKERGVPLIEDLGSGVLVPTERYGLAHEPTVQEAVASGVDIVTFSGDKLLGGPQAGIILGRREFVERCKKHPLARALRVDKMTLAALQATLAAYASGAVEEIPVWRMMGVSLETLQGRANALVAEVRRLAGPAGTGLSEALAVVESRSAIGGGSLPGETLPTWAVRVGPAAASPAVLAERLRKGAPPVVARVEDGALLLDLRTVDPEEDATVARRLVEALAGVAPAGEESEGV